MRAWESMDHNKRPACLHTLSPLSVLVSLSHYDEHSDYTVWTTVQFGAWICSEVTACWETSNDYCETLLTFCSSQPHGDCCYTEGNFWEQAAILSWLESGKYSPNKHMRIIMIRHLFFVITCHLEVFAKHNSHKCLCLFFWAKSGWPDIHNVTGFGQNRWKVIFPYR